MKFSKKIIAIVAGAGLLAAGAAASYWQSTQQQWCVRFTSSGSQEVTYSRGCASPQRYKKWVITASADRFSNVQAARIHKAL